MKVKVDLKKAVDYAAAGLEVECYLVVDGEAVGEPISAKKKPKRKRSLVTRDETTYKMTGHLPKFMKGTKCQMALEAMCNLYKGGAQQRTRSQIDGYLTQHFAWDHRSNMSVIANFRRDGILEVVRI